MKDLPFEFRCRHCGFEEEVVVTVAHRRSEAEGLAHDRAERALLFYRCPRCGKRDLASIVFKSFLFFVLANAMLAALLFSQAMRSAGGGPRAGLLVVLDSPLLAMGLEVALAIGVVISLRTTGSVRPRD